MPDGFPPLSGGPDVAAAPPAVVVVLGLAHLLSSHILDFKCCVGCNLLSVCVYVNLSCDVISLEEN